MMGHTTVYGGKTWKIIPEFSSNTRLPLFKDIWTPYNDCNKFELWKVTVNFAIVVKDVSWIAGRMADSIDPDHTFVL